MRAYSAASPSSASHDARTPSYVVPTRAAQPSFKRFGTLGIVAQHEHGHVEGRCFLLHAARIRQHEGASCHEVGEIGVSERFDEGDARMPAQRPLGYRAHGGVLVHGVHHAHVSVGVCRVAYCSEHARSIGSPRFSRRWHVNPKTRNPSKSTASRAGSSKR